MRDKEICQKSNFKKSIHQMKNYENFEKLH